MSSHEGNRRGQRASKAPNEKITKDVSIQYRLPDPQKGVRDRGKATGIPSVSSYNNKKGQKDVKKYPDDGVVTAIYTIKIVKKTLFGKEKSYESQTDIKTFEDKYLGGTRLNIFGHGFYYGAIEKFRISSTFDKKGEAFSEDEALERYYEGKGRLLNMEELYRELIKRYPNAFGDTKDPAKGFDVIRLISCHSADGEMHSGGQELANLTNINVQAHEDDLEVKLRELIMGVGITFTAKSEYWKTFKPRN